MVLPTPAMPCHAMPCHAVQSPDISTPVSFQDLHAHSLESFNFFRSSKFHFAELRATKKFIYMLDAVLDLRLRLGVWDRGESSLRRPPISEQKGDQEAALCFRIFYVAVSVCL